MTGTCGAEHFLNNGARGIQQSARRVQLNDQRVRAVGLSPAQYFRG